MTIYYRPGKGTQHRIQDCQGGSRNMNYKAPQMAVIFFMTSFNKNGGGHGPPVSAAGGHTLLAPPPPHLDHLDPLLESTHSWPDKHNVAHILRFWTFTSISSRKTNCPKTHLRRNFAKAKSKSLVSDSIYLLWIFRNRKRVLTWMLKARLYREFAPPIDTNDGCKRFLHWNIQKNANVFVRCKQAFKILGPWFLFSQNTW